MVELKKFQEMAFYDLLLSAECCSQPEVIRTGAYWLNHICIVDNIFRAHLLGERHNYQSTESDDVPALPSLRQSAADNNEWLMDYAGSLTANKQEERVEFIFTDGARGNMTRAEILLHLLTHSQNHLSWIASVMAGAGLPTPPMLLTTLLGRQHKA